MTNKIVFLLLLVQPWLVEHLLHIKLWPILSTLTHVILTKLCVIVLFSRMGNQGEQLNNLHRRQNWAWILRLSHIKTMSSHTVDHHFTGKEADSGKRSLSSYIYKMGIKIPVSLKRLLWRLNKWKVIWTHGNVKTPKTLASQLHSSRKNIHTRMVCISLKQCRDSNCTALYVSSAPGLYMTNVHMRIHTCVYPYIYINVSCIHLTVI